MMDMGGSKIVKDDEIDLFEIVRNVWSKRRFIVKVASIFFLFGIVVAFTSRREYQATTKLLPELNKSSGSGLGSLGGIAGLAGIDISGLSNSSGGLSTELYPELIRSLPFTVKLMQDTLYFESEDIHTNSTHYFEEVMGNSLSDYLVDYTIKLPWTILSSFSEQEITVEQEEGEFYRFPKEKWQLIENFSSRISLFMNEETGLITIYVEMPDPYAAAQLTEKVKDELTKQIIAYKTQKARTYLEFVTKTHDEAKQKFENLQFRLASATDQNRNVSSATSQIQLKNIEYQYNVAFDIYKGLATQLEQAKIKLKEDTPIFTVVEQASIPFEKSKPKRIRIMALSIFIGIVISTVFVLWKAYFPAFKAKLLM